MEGKGHYWNIYLERQIAIYFKIYVSNGYGCICLLPLSSFLTPFLSLFPFLSLSHNQNACQHEL